MGFKSFSYHYSSFCFVLFLNSPSGRNKACNAIFESTWNAVEVYIAVASGYRGKGFVCLQLENHFHCT